MQPATHKNKSFEYDRAKKLRRQFSPYEQKLWVEMRKLNKEEEIKFRRQQPISPYIADFACMEAKLIVELDGDSHDSRQEYDRRRDTYLRRLGFEVIRFSNKDVMSDLSGVVRTIMLKAKLLIENPSPAKTKGLLAQAQVFSSSPARGEEK